MLSEVLRHVDLGSGNGCLTGIRFIFPINAPKIDGYKNRVLAFVDLDKRPPLLNYGWCLGAHLTLFPSLPYRIWMSSITGKVDTTVHKLVWTASPSDVGSGTIEYEMERDEETAAATESQPS